MRFTVENNCEQVPDVLARIEAYLEEQTVPPDIVMTASLCLEELLTNTVSYAYPDGGSHEILVDITADDEALSIEIIDDGVAFDPLHDAAEPDIDAPVETRRVGGLGIHLVKNLMDEVTYRRFDDRNHLSLSKRLAPASSVED
jgi:serine/threonine-protein kinase RsbW